MWEALYENFWVRLVHYCARLTREETRAEDLAQETFLRAMQHAELLAGLNLRQQKAWLFETAHNLFCDQARRAAREQELLAQLAPGGGAEPPDPAAADALAGVETAALLNQLDPEARALFQLRYDEGYNAAELGQLFGQPPATIRTRLLKARNTLKKHLTEE